MYIVIIINAIHARRSVLFIFYINNFKNNKHDCFGECATIFCVGRTSNVPNIEHLSTSCLFLLPVLSIHTEMCIRLRVMLTCG